MYNKRLVEHFIFKTLTLIKSSMNVMVQVANAKITAQYSPKYCPKNKDT